MFQALKHWRLVLHLLLGTPRFGVNNQWKVGFDSVFRAPIFGFGYGMLLQPWKWISLLKVLRLRMEIAGWRHP
jgi:hypothetical protein